MDFPARLTSYHLSTGMIPQIHRPYVPFHCVMLISFWAISTISCPDKHRGNQPVDRTQATSYLTGYRKPVPQLVIDRKNAIRVEVGCNAQLWSYTVCLSCLNSISFQRHHTRHHRTECLCRVKELHTSCRGASTSAGAVASKRAVYTSVWLLVRFVWWP